MEEKEVTPESMWNLKLHEETYINGFRIVRVPGGWIYDKWHYGKQDYSFNPIFVPLHNEFLN